MSIEVTLERIAQAVEKLVSLATTNKIGGAPPAGTTTEERNEKVAAAAVAKSAKVKAQKTAAEKPVEPPKTEVLVVTSDETAPDDDFLDEKPAATPVKAVTVEEVRAALVALRGRKGKDDAFKVLADNGGGAEFLPGSVQAQQTGNSGKVLKPEFFAAVLKAALAA